MARLCCRVHSSALEASLCARSASFTVPNWWLLTGPKHGLISQYLRTWLWHCPFLTFEKVTGFRYLPNSNHIHRITTELIEMPLVQVSNLMNEKTDMVFPNPCLAEESSVELQPFKTTDFNSKYSLALWSSLRVVNLFRIALEKWGHPIPGGMFGSARWKVRIATKR